MSGRADSAVRLPLIPYYPASPPSFSFFSPFLITVSLRPPSFIVALPLPGLSLSQAAREKIISFCADTKRNLSFKRGCANTHRAPVPVLQPASRPRSPNLFSTPFQKEKKEGKEKTVCLYPACILACGYLHNLSFLSASLTRYAEEQVFPSTAVFISSSRRDRARGAFVLGVYYDVCFVQRSTTCWTYFQNRTGH